MQAEKALDLLWECLKLSNFTLYFRTLHIFGAGDTAISVAPAQSSAAWVEDYSLHLLEGVSHWVQEQEPDRVNTIIQQFIQK